MEYVGIGMQLDGNIVIAAAATIVDAPKVRGGGSPLAFIMEPSLELAHQTFVQIDLFKKYLPRHSNTPYPFQGTLPPYPFQGTLIQPPFST